MALLGLFGMLGVYCPHGHDLFTFVFLVSDLAFESCIGWIVVNRVADHRSVGEGIIPARSPLQRFSGDCLSRRVNSVSSHWISIPIFSYHP